MLLRELYIQDQKIDEAVMAIPLWPILQQILMFGGTSIAAYVTSKALEQAEIEFPNIELDFKRDLDKGIEIPTGPTLPMQMYDVPAEELQKYLDGVEASELAAARAIDQKMGSDNRDPNKNSKKIRAGDIIEQVISWLIKLIGLRAFKFLVGLGLGLIAIYTIYKMTKWITNWFKSDKNKEELEKAKQESLDERQVWARSGKKVVRKYRCTSGSRKGRTVSTLAQCFAAPDVKKRIQLKKTKARLGKRISRKAKRTKRINPASRRVQKLNRPSRRR